ncbi:UPF0692 protein C19orf54-like [Anneissia japonica]|uniref:UPF0692 protein C19orf54-like n=1 Tax=Anneissia japonica TaxID=1529436 RepID=UPI0014254FC8|nr:UPF0692 protein C19orf54-like [Anneissia japonica]
MDAPPVPPPPPMMHNAKGIHTDSEHGQNAKKVQFIKPSQPHTIGIAEVRAKLTCLPAWRNEQLAEQLSTWVSVYHPVAAILQEGPKCGVVALCMANYLLNTRPVSADCAFKAAKAHGFTMYGEMFSVINMCKLAEELLDCEAIRLTSGLSDSKIVYKHLDNGWPILVPYDKDESNSPCCRRGNKAHWAVITGYLVRLDSLPDSLKLNQDQDMSNLYHVPKNVCLSSKIACLLQEADSSSIYVYGKQGKSNHLGIWSYQDLLLSNSNLLEWHAGKNDVDERDMVLSGGGIEQGLCNQIILLKPKSEKL